jgi:hypothetical protein
VRKDVTFQTTLANGKPWTEFLTKHPYFKKLQGNKKDWQNGLSMPLVRMAEVYLIYAEAQIKATGNNSDASALEALNKIVRRAYGLPLNTPSDKDYKTATQKQVVQEKAWEFAGEYCRWFDLVRLEMVAEVVAKKDKDDLQPLGPTNVYYLPLPATETAANPNLATK